MKSLCSVLQGPAVASPKEKLYEQMTSNPVFTEKNTKTQSLSPRFSSGAKICGHVSHSTELVRMCLACQHLSTSAAPIGSPIICMWSPADICEQWERNLSFSSTDVCGAGTRDEALRMSAWEANRDSASRQVLLFFSFVNFRTTSLLHLLYFSIYSGIETLFLILNIHATSTLYQL